MKTLIPVVSTAGLAVVLAVVVTSASVAHPDPLASSVPDPVTVPTPPEPAPERRPVDLVICLDTSGSMTNLIDSARAKLWDVVNELATAKPTPILRVGLLTYGSPKLASAEEGYVVRQLDLTSDLDTVHAKMMAMTTNGGDEYVGWVLNDAVHTMSWSADPQALKMIFVAGNESADQASNSYNFRHVAEVARVRDVVINAFFAGDQQRGVAEHWNEVATSGGGYYAAIIAHQGTIQIATPHDAMLEELNRELNSTYIPYGYHAAEGVANQIAQDDNAAKLGVQSQGSRTAAKATDLYDNSLWDLVDASKDDEFDLDRIEVESLPEKMKPMAPPERKAYVEGMRAARGAIQEKIRKINTERDKFLKEERAKRHPAGAALDQAMRRAIRDQAARKQFKFNEEAARSSADDANKTDSKQHEKS